MKSAKGGGEKSNNVFISACVLIKCSVSKIYTNLWLKWKMLQISQILS